MTFFSLVFLSVLNRYHHPNIIAGQGTFGLKIVEQVPDIDAVVVPVGGAGLIAGVAIAVKAVYPSCMIMGSNRKGARVIMRRAKPVNQPTPTYNLLSPMD
ncbi:L-threonine dehydratase catabolic TdcB-like [Odontomachus brunneus]|uniref:L-threonine dehydratase catabolic TdcB-like n=1 Tax=Odontomachus brunneus TaxID=486640 RepID=UPI0013F20E41|nr:L-threonine dehydratase catabolic TdcB-like [Odontomachus brunneus]